MFLRSVYLQINYGGIPRGMYDHFYDGIRMAGENSPHAVLSPQSVSELFPLSFLCHCFLEEVFFKAFSLNYCLKVQLFWKSV